MLEVKFCSLFVASPSDVEERKLIPELVNLWNSTNSSSYKVGFTTSMWEANISPEFGDRPQELINSQLLLRSDLAIVIFWNRYGVPTGKEDSGTYEELVEAIKKGIRTGLFFSQKPIPPRYIDLDGQQKIRSLKAKIHSQEFVSNGIYQDYLNEYDFKEYFLRFLSKHAEAYNANTNANENVIEPNESAPDTQLPEAISFKVTNGQPSISGQSFESRIPSKLGKASVIESVEISANDIENCRKLLSIIANNKEKLRTLSSISYEKPFNPDFLDPLSELLNFEFRFESFRLEDLRRRLYSFTERLLRTISSETFPSKMAHYQEVPREWIAEQPERHFRVLKNLVTYTSLVSSYLRRMEVEGNKIVKKK